MNTTLTVSSQGKKVAVSGAGNVAIYTAENLECECMSHACRAS